MNERGVKRGLGVELIVADCIDAMAALPTESVHLTFTSPPYFNARGYAHYESYSEYLDFLTAAFGQVLRLTKPGRYCVINSSPVLVARPIDGSSTESTRLGIPFDLHARLSAQGWAFAEDIIWRKPLGSVPRRRGGWLRHGQAPLTWKPDLVTEYLLAYRKPGRLTRDCLADYSAEVRNASRMPSDFERSNIWEVQPASHPNHPAVFPVSLAERCIRAWSMVGDTVLDPFAGVGTVGSVAQRLGRCATLIERDAGYAALAQRQLDTERQQALLHLAEGQM